MNPRYAGNSRNEKTTLVGSGRMNSSDFASVAFRAPEPPRPWSPSAALVNAMHVVCLACFISVLPVAIHAKLGVWAPISLVAIGIFTSLIGIASRRYVFVVWLIVLVAIVLVGYALSHAFDGWQH